MIRVAFATDDRQTVNLHFGASEQFVIYDVAPGVANLVGVWQFVKLQMKGVNAERNPDEPLPAVSEERMSEDKVIEKIELLRSCAGVYAAKIGTSSIKRLMQFDIPCLSGWLTKSFAASLSLAARFDYSARRAEELVVLDQDRALLVERSAHAG